MARGVITLGGVAARAAMIELRCGHCERQGRLSKPGYSPSMGLALPMGAVMRAQLGDCPHRDDAQLQHRCDPYCPDLARLFQRPKASWSRGAIRIRQGDIAGRVGNDARNPLIPTATHLIVDKFDCW
jgi:hypothetical protein